MTLSFSIGSIAKDIRSRDGKNSLSDSALILLGDYIETIETRITVRGFEAMNNGAVNLTFDYFEELKPGVTINEFEARAILFAKDWCKTTGAHGKAAK
jgi:hypothetical protein